MTETSAITPEINRGPAAAILPSISIVVPSFNGSKYIEETLRSLIEQDYPALEIIVIDGGSTDGSVEIIKKYAHRSAYWESEHDSGQSHAINKGFARCTGEIVNWLCSDDVLTPGALQLVAAHFADKTVDVVAGRSRWIYACDASRSSVEGPSDSDLQRMPATNLVQQPSCFFRRSLLREQAVREELHYTMDLELWAYLRLIHARWITVPDVLSVYRFTGVNKTSIGGMKSWLEWKQLFREYGSRQLVVSAWCVEHIRGPLRRVANRNLHGASSLAARCCDFALRQVLRPFAPQITGDVANTYFWLATQESQQ